ncbi:MAG TPA: glycosyltransferase [Ramlibacter sp.]|jgi:glycosyltransferase involved in cell wall biosynthesis
MIRVASVHYNLLPYHVARYRAMEASAGARFSVQPMLLGGTAEYRQIAASSTSDHGLEVRRVATGPGWRQRVHAMLAELQPDVILLAAGYGQRDAITVMQWAVVRQVPVVLCSDSQERDAPRAWWKEQVKRLLVRCCASYFAAGSRHVDYLVKLGAGRERISVGLDVVDNDHFSAIGADVASRKTGEFLACARLVEKKNLHTLIAAYARYLVLARTAQPASMPWRLAIVGDGPLRASLEKQVDALGVRESVRFEGFLPYAALPGRYAAASAFILPSSVDQWGLVVNEAMAARLPVLVSTQCGCAPELVLEGINGFTFPPHDVERLAALMLSLWSQGGKGMGLASYRLISDWGLDRYVSGLSQALEIAVTRPSQSAGLASRALLRIWMR